MPIRLGPVGLYSDRSLAPRKRVPRAASEMNGVFTLTVPGYIRSTRQGRSAWSTSKPLAPVPRSLSLASTEGSVSRVVVSIVRRLLPDLGRGLSTPESPQYSNRRVRGGGGGGGTNIGFSDSAGPSIPRLSYRSSSHFPWNPVPLAAARNYHDIPGWHICSSERNTKFCHIGQDPNRRCVGLNASMTAPASEFAKGTLTAASNAIYSHPVYAVIGLVLFYCIQVRYVTCLRDVRGPFWASLTQFWKLSNALQGRHEVVMMELHRRYGRFSPPLATVFHFVPGMVLGRSRRWLTFDV